MASNVPPVPPQPPVASAAPVPAPAAKKVSPWVWVGVGCGALLVIALLVVLLGGLFVARKVKDIAKDAEANPTVAAARMVVRLNPELEEVSSDLDRGTITIRNRKTGEVVTLDASEIEKGRISFSGGKKGESVKIDFGGEAEQGRFRVESDKGTMEWGTGDGQQTPGWVPAYPGAAPQGVFSARGDDGVSGAFTFATADDISTVLAFFEARLKGKGFTVNTATFQQDGRTAGGTLNASLPNEERTVNLMLGSEKGEATQVTVTYSEKP